MGTEQFNHRTPVVGTAPNVKLQHALVGEPVAAVGRENAAGNPNIQPAGLFSTAPYVPPSTSTNCIRDKADGSPCGMARMKGYKVCAAHGRSEGIIEWSGKPKPK